MDCILTQRHRDAETQRTFGVQQHDARQIVPELSRDTLHINAK